jgi:hypothetical protein
MRTTNQQLFLDDKNQVDDLGACARTVAGGREAATSQVMEARAQRYSAGAAGGPPIYIQAYELRGRGVHLLLYVEYCPMCVHVCWLIFVC